MAALYSHFMFDIELVFDLEITHLFGSWSISEKTFVIGQLWENSIFLCLQMHYLQVFHKKRIVTLLLYIIFVRLRIFTEFTKSGAYCKDPNYENDVKTICLPKKHSKDWGNADEGEKKWGLKGRENVATFGS